MTFAAARTSPSRSSTTLASAFGRLNAPLALAATKRVIVESADWPADEAFSKQGEIISPIFGSKDAMEGAMAFAEKRQPVWRGE